tara:strand:- start:5447 stop:6001 length:555 start_codon:yes stop_codon:yes gene_type:complete
MILPVIAFGSQILREKCVNISKDLENFTELVDNMWETMYAAHGVGLAAPQINRNLRLFIIDTAPFVEDDTGEKPVKKVFVNPVIIEESGEEWEFNEGCLSIPEVREDIKRKSIIKIEYFDQNFNKHIEEYNGVTARVIQHEYDHINGVLFIDKISPLRKRMIKGKLIDISKGKIPTNYKMKIVK